MAKDDYFVIVYQVLKYLYGCLKKGENPEICFLQAATYSIPESYWMYIVSSLFNEKYIEGITIYETKSGTVVGNLQDTFITPKGIEYLLENSLIQKAKRTLKDIKEMTLFI